MLITRTSKQKTSQAINNCSNIVYSRPVGFQAAVSKPSHMRHTDGYISIRCSNTPKISHADLQHPKKGGRYSKHVWKSAKKEKSFPFEKIFPTRKTRSHLFMYKSFPFSSQSPTPTINMLRKIVKQCKKEKQKVITMKTFVFFFSQTERISSNTRGARVFVRAAKRKNQTGQDPYAVSPRGERIVTRFEKRKVTKNKQK